MFFCRIGNKKNRQRSGKSTQLKGIAKSRKQAKERIYGGKDSSDSSKSDSGDKNENRLVTASDDTSVNESASSRKIAQKSSCEDGERSKVERFLLLDSKLLCRYLDNVSKCGICESSLKTKPSYADRQGFSCSINGYCAQCKTETKLFYTSDMCDKVGVLSDAATKRPSEVNMRMVSFARAVGKGKSCLDEFTKCMNMPDAIHQKSYETLFNYHHDATIKAADESMKKAGDEVRNDIGRSDISVSEDGSWQRRGHASHNGVVTVISTDTGKCLDIEVISNMCK